MTYLPVNARSECVEPSTRPFGGVVESIRMFHAAWPASQRPALRPTRVSGTGAAGVGAAAGGAVVAGGGVTAGGGVAAGGVGCGAAAGGVLGVTAGGAVFDE